VVGFRRTDHDEVRVVLEGEEEESAPAGSIPTYWLLLKRVLTSGNIERRQVVTSGAFSWAQFRHRRQGKDDSGFLPDTF